MFITWSFGELLVVEWVLLQMIFNHYQSGTFKKGNTIWKSVAQMKFTKNH